MIAAVWMGREGGSATWRITAPLYLAPHQLLSSLLEHLEHHDCLPDPKTLHVYPTDEALNLIGPIIDMEWQRALASFVCLAWSLARVLTLINLSVRTRGLCT